MFLPAIKGFAFTLEALISLMLLVMIISIPIEENKNDLEKIYVLQKENDLIKVWIKTKTFKGNELKKDFKKLFPFQKGEIIINGKKTEIKGEKKENEIKSEGFYYENSLKKISIKVFI